MAIEQKLSPMPWKNKVIKRPFKSFRLNRQANRMQTAIYPFHGMRPDLGKDRIFEEDDFFFLAKL